MSELGNVEGHAFISYAREDSLRVDHLQRVLEAAGVRVWRDTANLWLGEDWRAEIRRAITTDALVFLVCFSRGSVARSVSYQNEELTLAIEQLRLRRPGVSWLIPVRFDDADIPDIDIGGGRTLLSIQCSDLFGARSADNTERLVKVVLRLLGRTGSSAAADRAGGSPAGSQHARELARSAPISDKPAKITTIRAPHAVSAVAFSPDAARLALGCDMRLALVTDLTGREQLRVRHGGMTARVWAVAFDHEGMRLATGCNDHTARIWHTATGGQLLHITHAAVVYGVAFSPDGRLLTTGAGDKAARIWDTATGGQLLEVAQTEGDGVLDVAFSPDGRLLATGSDDKTARIWDTATGYQLLEVTHSEKVRVVDDALRGGVGGLARDHR